MNNPDDVVTGMAVTGIILCMYFMPYLVAWKRGHRNARAIGVLNLFLGWTLIGWIGSLVWAFTSNTIPKTNSNEGLT